MPVLKRLLQETCLSLRVREIASSNDSSLKPLVDFSEIKTPPNPLPPSALFYILNVFKKPVGYQKNRRPFASFSRPNLKTKGRPIETSPQAFPNTFNLYQKELLSSIAIFSHMLFGYGWALLVIHCPEASFPDRMICFRPLKLQRPC